MGSERVYHGSNGDRILSIIASGELRPDPEGRVFFARHGWAGVLQHGGDRKRKAAFALALDVEIPPATLIERKVTPGIPDTFIVHTPRPLKAKAVTLFVRNPGATQAELVNGSDAITRYLLARQGPLNAGEDD
jgi:hypothetical protein